MTRYWVLLALLLGFLSAGPAGAAPDPETANTLARLAVQRRDAARRTYEALWLDYRERRAPEDLLYRWSLRWLEADRELSDQQADRVAAYQGHFERMRDLDRIIRRLHGSGQITIEEASATEYYRVEAELWLLKAKEGKKNP
jgi:hypothetical protein